jgi:uncharacterized protein YecE (DUF72 family)
MLETWAERIRAWRGKSLDIFFYCNNDWHAYALKNAQTLKKMLKV